jgi:hypothetical protein
MTAIRLTLAILLLAGLAAANSTYEQVNTTDFLHRSDAYQGRLVAVTGQVCAVNADGKSLRLFDAGTKGLIDVDLSQLSKSQRRSVMNSPIREVSVYGRAELIDGKLVVRAHQLVTSSGTVIGVRPTASSTDRG